MITAATFRGYTRTGSNTYRVTVRFTDDSRPAYEEDFTVTGTTLAAITNDIRRQIAERIAVDNVSDVLAGIPVDTAIPITAPAPPTPPAPDPLDDWARRFRLVAALQAFGPAPGAMADRLAALKTAVQSEYTAANAATRLAGEDKLA